MNELGILGFGTMGAAIAQGIARGWGSLDAVTSPTFTIINEYRGGARPLFHIDLYRLKDPAELESIGFEEYVDSDGATVIEWAERADEELPEELLRRLEQFQLLAARRDSLHQAHHEVMECLGEMIWQSQRSAAPPDGERYVDCVRRRASATASRHVPRSTG